MHITSEIWILTIYNTVLLLKFEGNTCPNYIIKVILAKIAKGKSLLVSLNKFRYSNIN